MCGPQHSIGNISKLTGRAGIIEQLDHRPLPVKRVALVTLAAGKRVFGTLAGNRRGSPPSPRWRTRLSTGHLKPIGSREAWAKALGKTSATSRAR